MLDTETGEIVNLTLMHEGNGVREFYSQLPRPVLVGIEATGGVLRQHYRVRPVRISVRLLGEASYLNCGPRLPDTSGSRNSPLLP